MYNMATNTFEDKIGPVYSNFVLLDEINRSSAKTQSAMLEAMQEREVSIGGKTYKLPEVFVVIATQNPIESEVRMCCQRHSLTDSFSRRL